MVDDLFDRAFELLMHNEGGWVNDPDDPGGETKYGISKAQYPNVDIGSLSLGRAAEIYATDYWDRYRCGELPWPIALVLFDCVVNHSPLKPVRWLQKSLGITQDGIIGSVTVRAANANEEPLLVARDMLLDRLKYYQSLPGWEKYQNGWSRRVLDTLLSAALGDK